MNRPLKAILVITLASVVTSGFAVAGCSSNPTPTPGEELPTYRLEIDLLGYKNEFLIDSQGVLKSRVELTSADGGISLFMDKGTTVLEEDEKPLQIIRVMVDTSPPPPPENAYIVSSVYKLTPQSATFNPQVLFTLSYDTMKLPDGLREADLYVAYHDGTEWCKPHYRKVDSKLHSITTQLPDFNLTSIAILGLKELAPSVSPTTTQGIKVGNLAPDFQLNDLDGKPVYLNDLRGRPVMLNFWATWCGPCVSEMAYIQRVYEESAAKNLALLAINMDGTSSQVKQFLQSRNLSLPVLIDTKQDVAETYNIRYIPTTFFIDETGIIQAVKIGAFPNEESIEQELTKIIP